jgi:hypothetical protein
VPVPPEELTVAGLAKKSYLIPSQRHMIQESVEHLNFMMRDPETREVAVPNTDRLVSNLRKDEQMLAEGTPPEYDSVTKNKLNRLRIRLEEEIQRGMPTADMMEKPTPNNIDLHVWWERENVQRVAAWKAICRTLDPHNAEPNFTNIARLRPSTPPAGNPRKYWQNFDAVSWAEGIEETLLSELDDTIYHLFLELKLLDWTKAGICKELALTPEMYEAAMERLRTSKTAKRTLEVAEPDSDEEEDDAELAEEEDEEKEEPQEKSTVKKRATPAYEQHTWIRDRIRQTGMSLTVFAKRYQVGGASFLSTLINGTKPLSAKKRADIEMALDQAEAVIAQRLRDRTGGHSAISV